MVIVTKNQYLICKSILDITLDEHFNSVPTTRSKFVKRPYYMIVMHYVTDVVTSATYNSSSTSDSIRQCEVTIDSKHDAYSVFRDIVKQIRDQMPDQLFLDKALERLLATPLKLQDVSDDSTKDSPDHEGTIIPKKPRKTKKTPRKSYKAKKRRGSKK